jgi:hypothetical protein
MLDVLVVAFIVSGVVFAYKVKTSNGTPGETLLAFWVFGSIGGVVAAVVLLLAGLVGLA